MLSGPGYNETEKGKKIQGRKLRNKKIPRSLMDKIKRFVTLAKPNNYYNNYKKKNQTKGGSQFVHIPNYGKRKVRYQKNGRAYIIINKKKFKLN